MESVDPFRFILAFMFVLGLIGLCAMALKRYSQTAAGIMFLSRSTQNPSGEQNRLHVIEVRYLDARRKLMLVKRDNVEHLLLLADNRELVVESNIAISTVSTHSGEPNA